MKRLLAFFANKCDKLNRTRKKWKEYSLKSQGKKMDAIKKSGDAEKGLFYSKWSIIISACVVAALIVGVLTIVGFSIKNSDNDTGKVKGRTDPATSISATPKSAEINKLDWKLTLVNNENPIKTTKEIKTVKVGNNQYVDERIETQLKKMLADAKAAGVKPLICSSYRTEEKQKSLFDNKVKKNKNSGMDDDEAVQEAAGWVAYPGTSEHQLGLAVDIVDLDHQSLDSSQEKTAATKWLMENCQNYGFILRYPTEKSEITGVNYEPWHYRYVGEDVAKEIMKREICLEEYLSQK